MEGLPDYAKSAVMKEGQEARYEQDSKMLVHFYVKPRQNKFKSDEAGRPIFEDREYVRIMIPGDRNSIVDQPVKEEHKIRFRDRYKLFREGEEQVQSGTALSEWPQMTRSHVEELKFFGIRTVEQLAEMDDIHGQKMLAFHDLKRRAVAFLESSKAEAENSKLAQELEKRDDEIATLKEQVAQLLQAQPKTPGRGRAKKE